MYTCEEYFLINTVFYFDKFIKKYEWFFLLKTSDFCLKIKFKRVYSFDCFYQMNLLQLNDFITLISLQYTNAS